MKKEETFYIGYITRTKGLKGELQVYFDFEDYEELDLDVVFIELNSKLVPHFSASVKVYPNRTALFFFDDIDHIDKATPLVKKKVYLAADKLPERDPEELRYEDLKGFTAIDRQYGSLGEILTIHEYPQQYVASVLYKDREILFPLSDDFIEEIDEKEKTIRLMLPEGLLDIYMD